jgi:transcriptional regulator with XRE-family HTH domain
MPTKIDVRRLGMLIRGKRERENLTLKDVAELTGLKIPTISRVERGASDDVEGGTLLTLTRWLGTNPEEVTGQHQLPTLPAGKSKPAHTTPDVVELYLRADKNLDKTTAAALATMFRTAYETMSKRIRAKQE